MDFLGDPMDFLGVPMDFLAVLGAPIDLGRMDFLEFCGISIIVNE